jgi:hypothetical protein
MCNYVQEQLKLPDETPFENGAAFYRLPKEGADLLYYKDVLHPPALNDKVHIIELGTIHDYTTEAIHIKGCYKSLI